MHDSQAYIPLFNYNPRGSEKLKFELTYLMS